ncbi:MULTISPECIES: TIGR03808 family TAT-translocated repetitive protein [unclassified Rhizobium]|uniref:TIGR03808 family TAT-translocated repetitive protein n=1 Tax=unclassified Rhizobium TaxID=2613769 RepID=UPI000CDF52B4|nr:MULTISPECIES: TIGR03808 family TAT-translocated repetitive protein [Rhizobium]AVA20745.1 pectin lyase fold/virulence factor domain-containing protein [Rhizobium sp. NXC24]MDK4738890.1 TIGR03808 family TAT-translocated repetitive protein [Rhizobium sp. CNPSo 3464]UWU21960.1 TIGR03808 family TAT-translocated repetitive protein [Rhizobium tropici]
MVQRRAFLAYIAASAATDLFASHAFAAPLAKIAGAEMRGPIDAIAYRATPGTSDIRSGKLQAMIDNAARNNAPVFLPPGNYDVSNLSLPDNTRITGIPGASRLVYGGEGHLMSADKARRIELSGLVVDGGNRWLADYAGGLLQFTGVDQVLIDNCEIAGSRKHALQLERCGGRIERSRISGAAEAGLYSVQSTGLTVTGNTVEDCGNGGILIHRWDKGADGSIVTGNRIARIGANDGGTGQNGNGINIFRADDVLVSGNHIADCAFTAVRANSASNVQITGNQCLRSGETAIFCEFEFEGAVVSNNLVDGAANGIAIANFDKGGRLASVTGNIIRNLSLTGPYPQESGFGIGISAEADTLIASNLIESAPLWGLKLGWGPYLRNIVANGNIIRQAPIGCAVSVADGAGAAVISDNLFQQVEKGAVIGFRWDKPASGDLTVTGREDFPQLTIEKNRLT